MNQRRYRSPTCINRWSLTWLMSAFWTEPAVLSLHLSTSPNALGLATADQSSTRANCFHSWQARTDLLSHVYSQLKDSRNHDFDQVLGPGVLVGTLRQDLRCFLIASRPVLGSNALQQSSESILRSGREPLLTTVR